MSQIASVIEVPETMGCNGGCWIQAVTTWSLAMAHVAIPFDTLPPQYHGMPLIAVEVYEKRQDVRGKLAGRVRAGGVTGGLVGDGIEVANDSSAAGIVVGVVKDNVVGTAGGIVLDTVLDIVANVNRRHCFQSMSRHWSTYWYLPIASP